MLKWIENYFHKQELREIQREKELLQAKCIHEWSYLGEFTYEYYTGIDVDFYHKHKIRCHKCDKERTFTYEREALAYCNFK